MKLKLLISGLIAMFCVLTTQGQTRECFLYDMNVAIPLYASYQDEVPAVLLYQDSISSNFYSLELLENKGNRFRVHVTGDSDTVNVHGWIDKKFCTVWLWLMETNSIYLFSDPNANSKFQEVHEDEMIYGEDGYCGTILEFSKEISWLKISVPTQSGYVYGWTLNYCGNIYGSCEGDRARTPSRVYGEAVNQVK